MKVLGFLMLAIPCAFIIKSMIKNNGWLVTFVICGLISLLIAYIMLAVHLM